MAETGVVQGGLQEERDLAVGNRAHHILRTDRGSPHALIGFARIVQGRLRHPPQPMGAASDDGLHQGGRQGKGRHGFRRLHGTQSARGAGAHIDQTPTRGQPVRHHLRAGRHHRRPCPHGLDRPRLLVNQQLDHVLGRQRV
jgi:hypothetical protein